MRHPILARILGNTSSGTRRFVLAALAVTLGMASAVCAQDVPAFPAFRMHEIDTGLKAGWAVFVEDVNGDGKKDIIVVSPPKVVWCENPTWKVHTLVEESATKHNNMTIGAVDLAGKGRRGFVLGGGWTPKPFDTKAASSAVWLEPGKDVAAPWNVSLIADEPMIHRVRIADVLGEGSPQLIVAPMMGRGSTEANNWMDGQPVRILLYPIPKNPARDRWMPEVIDESLHVVHGVTPVARPDDKGDNLMIASYEGVHLFSRDRDSGKWTKKLLTAGNQANPKASRGSSDVKQGTLKGGKKFLATIEPWHGNEFVISTEPPAADKLWQRHVIDDQLKYGHAIWCADFDGDGADEVIVGVMQTLDKDKPGSRQGIRLYKAADAQGTKWVRHVLDDRIAVEDLTAVDLLGSGRLDIVAVDQQSGKLRIFFNQGMK